jgi:hypothetical protein
MIRRYVFLWLTGRGQRPSAREWARQRGISHTWHQKLVRQFQKDRPECIQTCVASEALHILSLCARENARSK